MAKAYRIHKGIRDLLVFSEQDIIKDPPFSKLDLISCRNLLIYLDMDLQRKLIPLFHYALKPGGWLFLGTSEGIGEFDGLFSVLDRKAKIYSRKEDLLGHQRMALARFLPPITALEAAVPDAVDKIAKAINAPGSLRQMTEQALIRQIIAAGVLVNNQGDILYLHGHTGMFFELSPGEAGINNVLKMARDGLRRELIITLQKAVSTKDTVASLGLRVKTNGHFTRVNLTVCPLTGSHGAAPSNLLFLIILEEVSAQSEERHQQIVIEPGPSDLPHDATTSDVEAHIAALKAELRAKEKYLQSTDQELESSAEELKSSNEEMQSVNEELQSSNEELETSKEELQSVNEELATVNTELQIKVMDLSRAYNDMNNLLSGTGIGTVFMDHQLRILRFTPAASTIINLIQGDLGRPVAHFVSNLVDYTSLVADVQSVLDTLSVKEVEAKTVAGLTYNLRIHPYRTLDNVIEGAVITFVEITEMVKARNHLRIANDHQLRLTVVLRDAHDAITVQDRNGLILAWNPGAIRLYGWSEAEALKMNVHERIPEAHRDGSLGKLEQLSRSEVLEAYNTQRLTKAGKIVEVSIISTSLMNEAGEMYAIATTERVK